MKRLLDIFLAALLAIPTIPVVALAALWIKCVSRGPVLYWSDRVGYENEIFSMPKLRTMQTDTPELATRLLTGADQWMIPGGRFLRSTSLDELPQLWSILVGDMSFVGPRPVLHQEYELTMLRTQRRVHELVPGLTGWAQVNGRDELGIIEKVELDCYYMEHRSIAFDFRILLLTAVKVLRRDGVAQAGEEPYAEEPVAEETFRAEPAHSDRRAA